MTGSRHVFEAHFTAETRQVADGREPGRLALDQYNQYNQSKSSRDERHIIW